MGLDPTRAYFSPAVNKRLTRLWPRYFLIRPEEIFLTRRVKNWKFDILRGNFPNPNPNHRWLTWPDPTQTTKNWPNLTRVKKFWSGPINLLAVFWFSYKHKAWSTLLAFPAASVYSQNVDDKISRMMQQHQVCHRI